MFDLARKIQAKSLLKALAISYRVPLSPSRAARVTRLAPSVHQFRPGVYAVGGCVVDLWRMHSGAPACTCAEQRAAKQAKRLHYCPHILAVYLAGYYTPGDLEPTAYLTRLKIAQPEIIAIYGRARLACCDQRHTVRLVESCGDGWYIVQNIRAQVTATARLDQISRLYPFYE